MFGIAAQFSKRSGALIFPPTLRSRSPHRRDRDERRPGAGQIPCSKPRFIKEMVMSSSVVLITGALTGIGRAAAVAFAKAGHRVVVSGRKPDAGEALVGELHASGAET